MSYGIGRLSYEICRMFYGIDCMSFLYVELHVIYDGLYSILYVVKYTPCLFNRLFVLLQDLRQFELRHEKTEFLLMRKQSRRSAV